MDYVKGITQDYKDKHKPTVFLQYVIKCLLGNWVSKEINENDCKSILINLCHVMSVHDLDFIAADHKFEEYDDEDDDQFLTMEDMEKMDKDREMKGSKEVDDADWGDIDMDELDDMDVELEMDD